MDEPPFQSRPSDPGPPPPPLLPPQQSGGGAVKKALGPLAVLAAFAAKFKGLLILAIKVLPTLATMLLSIWAYTLIFSWPFAVGFVLLIFVHECGHLLVAKRLGLKVGAPMFIPFVGALIALKQMPRNAWHEAWVGIGGPLLGGAGAAACYLVYCQTGSEFFGALAYTTFWLNLFNLAPVGFLDGGRIVTALSPWMWLIGTLVLVLMLLAHFNVIVLVILLLSLPRFFSLFRKRTPEEQRYYEVTPVQRLIMGGMYFGLIVLLFLGMQSTQPAQVPMRGRPGETITSHFPHWTFPT